MKRYRFRPALSRVAPTVLGFLALVTSVQLSAQAVEPDLNDVLVEYVDRKDDSFEWQVRHESKLGKTAYAELRMTSQTWRGIPWQHQLFIIMPKSADANQKSGLLVIAGGGWRDEYENPNYKTKLPSQAIALAALSEQMGMPIAVLLQVPHQPLFQLAEDALISHTFQEYLKTDDPEWPLLLPMVKSASAAMDTTQQYLSKKNDQPRIEGFVVTGASKRGWTTWLSAVADERVKGIAPMVIDVLNMPAQMKFMESCWGDQSHMISDYTEKGLHKAMETERGRQLTRIVDPYSYRKELTVPKLLMMGTNDPYWPVDALNVYWDQLPGPKHILYVPNAGHGIQSDIGRVLGGLTAFVKTVDQHAALPSFDWQHVARDGRLEVKVNAKQPPDNVVIWTASSDDRDFRDEKWTSHPAEVTANRWVGQTDRPTIGYKAVFAELVFECQPMPLKLSTSIKVYQAQ